LALSFDLSPLRPWEWARLAGDDARRWIIAIATQNAYMEGIAAARSEKAGWNRLSEKPVEPQA
jgi:hypothetical protein